MDQLIEAAGTLGVTETALATLGGIYVIGGQFCSLLSSLIPQEKMAGTWWGTLIDRWALNVGKAKNAGSP